MGMNLLRGRTGERNDQRIALTFRIGHGAGRYLIEHDAWEWVRCDDSYEGQLITYWRHGVILVALPPTEFTELFHMRGTTVPALPADPDFRPVVVCRLRNGDVHTVNGYSSCEWVRRPRRRWRKRQADDRLVWTFPDGRALDLPARDIHTIFPTRIAT